MNNNSYCILYSVLTENYANCLTDTVLIPYIKPQSKKNDPFCKNKDLENLHNVIPIPINW